MTEEQFRELMDLLILKLRVWKQNGEVRKGLAAYQAIWEIDKQRQQQEKNGNKK